MAVGSLVCGTRDAKGDRAELIQRPRGRITQLNQLPRRILGWRQGSLRVRIHDRQYLPAPNSADRQTLTLHRDHSILLVEEISQCLHFNLDARYSCRDSSFLFRVPILSLSHRSNANPSPDSCFPNLATNIYNRTLLWTRPASPSCWNPSFAPLSSLLQNLVIPNRRKPVRNLLSCPPPNWSIYRRTSIYSSAGTLAST
jgi:hypothetical protein